MKKLLMLLLLFLVAWTSYHDLTKGTLPQAEDKQTQTVTAKVDSKKMKYQKYTIKPGDTVLSVVERLNPEASVSIGKILADFKQLNPSVDPNQVQIGKSYTFPIYP